jgi:single-strand DNA-binding protein
MARDLNHVTLIGRLVKDPEIKYTASGVPVTKFSIANNSSYMQNNELVEYVSYFDINVWGNQAVNCEKYLKKGSQVAVNGVLRQNRWSDKTSGQTRSKVEITANSVQFLTPASSSQNINTSSKNVVDPGTNNNNGMIEDPWNNDSNSNTMVDNSFNESSNSDDDIPF